MPTGVEHQQRAERMRAQVRQHYGSLVRTSSSCCGSGVPAQSGCGPGCCGPATDLSEHAMTLGYAQADTGAVPEGANLGLGCGNPLAIASLQPGETVLDLGSGAGLDCFLAARQVGPDGHVIGVDMTPDMVARARANAQEADLPWVEFRLGEIEHLPVADASVDLIMSNCVVNLSPDKPAVMREAYRVLRPGGRLAIADTVATATLPEQARQDLALWSCCIAGASTVGEWHALLAEAGFVEIRIEPRESSRALIATWAPGSRAEDYVLSATIQAIKPGAPSAASCC